MSKSKLTKVTTFLVFVLALSAYPYIFNKFLPIPGIQFASFFVLFALLFILYINRCNKRLPVACSLCLYLQIAGWLFYYFLHHDISYFTRIYFLLLTFVVLFALQNTVGVNNFFKKYNGWIAILAALGGIAFILVFIGLLRPLFSFNLADERQAYFFGLTCSNSYIGNFVRVAGFFDEPGAFAFWGIFSLLINYLFVKSKIVEYSLLIGLLFTFSLAYFVQVAIYLVFLKIRGIKSLFLVGLFAAIVAGAVISQGEDSDIYIRSFQRVEKSQDKTNRDSMTDRAKEIWGHNVMFGVGGSNMAQYGYMGDNPYEILVKDGVIGYIITYLPIIFLLRASLRSFNLLIAISILFLGYQQRPFHIEFLHYFLLYSFLYLSIICKKQKYARTKSTVPSGNGHYSSV